MSKKYKKDDELFVMFKIKGQKAKTAWFTTFQYENLKEVPVIEICKIIKLRMNKK